MKHLLSIMAVFLLMGCQTTDTTPKDTISPEKVVKEEKPQMPPMELANPIIVHKPLLCADGQTLVTGAGDETLRFWKVFPPKKQAR